MSTGSFVCEGRVLSFLACAATQRMRAMSAALVALLLAACAGGGSVPPSVTGAQSGASHRGSLTLRIKVPHKKRHVRRSKAGKYISPATQSIQVAITGSSTQTLTADLTPTSTGCSSTLATTVCSLSLSLPPGTYSADISTYDGLGATGQLLSAGQAINFQILAGVSNSIQATLSGYPRR
jgi:hypothetical protein